MKKGILKKDTGVVIKKFDYELDGCTLKFDLRIDVKIQLKAYTHLLEQALKDVEAELAKIDGLK